MKDNRRIWWVTQSSAGYSTFKVRPDNEQGEDVSSVDDLEKYQNNIYFFSRKDAIEFCDKINEFVNRNYRKPSLKVGE